MIRKLYWSYIVITVFTVPISMFTPKESTITKILIANEALGLFTLWIVIPIILLLAIWDD